MPSQLRSPAIRDLDIMDDGWRAWVAENLMLGTDRAVIKSVLAKNGFSEMLGEQEIVAAEQSPYLAAGRKVARRAGKRDWHLANIAKLEALAGVHREVPRVMTPEPRSFFADYYYLNRPVILQGMMSTWPAFAKWSLDYFEEAAGDPVVEVQVGRESDGDYELRAYTHKSRARWSQILAALKADPTTNDFYITANNGGTNRIALGALWKDIGALPGILDSSAAHDGFFWLGPRGTVTPWHHDLTNNLLAQVRGRKRVTLVSASQTALMRNHQHCYSSFAGDPNLAGLAGAHAPVSIQFDLAPGEILFIPIGWWHHVEALDLSVSLSFTNFTADNDFSSYYGVYGDM